MPERKSGLNHIYISRRDVLLTAAGALLAACGVSSNSRKNANELATAQAKNEELKATIDAMRTNPTGTTQSEETTRTSVATEGTNTPEAQTPVASNTQTTEVQLEQTATPEVLPNRTFQIQGWSTMKLTKDRVCDQPTDEYIEKYVQMAKTGGVTHLALEVPLVDVLGQDEDNLIYCNGQKKDVLQYSRRWIKACRKNNINVIIRPPLISAEGIYNHPKKPDLSKSQELIGNYYSEIAKDLQKGDIVLLPPEPQNYGIKGSSRAFGGYGNCDNGCAFEDRIAFNEWIRETRATIKTALGAKLEEVTIGCCGVDGFTTIGYGNQDWEPKILSGEWESFIENATIDALGGILWIDHYPPQGKSMADFLSKFNKKFPNVKIVIGEFGDTEGRGREYVRQVLQDCANNPSVYGFVYWHGGPGGKEALLKSDLSPTDLFEVPMEFFTTNKRP